MVKRKPGILMRDRHWTGLTIACLLGGLVLRLDGARYECRIGWDEGRPNFERLLAPSLIGELGNQIHGAWGRPGALVAKNVAIAFGLLCGIAFTVYSARDLLEQNMWLVAASRERILLRSEGMWSAEP
jgi:hypothetical protein